MTKPPYIFLIEDDADDRFMMQQAFAEVNFASQVRMFSSSDFFITYISSITDVSELPTLFVLDFNMPVLNGGDLLLRLKQHELLKSIPVVLYSTGMRPILKETLIASGASECFEKASDYNELCKLVKTLRMMAEGSEVVY
jgi:CheY-like chemotaxis protein